MNGPSATGFVHLHVRSGFSYGYGTATPGEIVEAGASMGMQKLALTDRDGLYGVPVSWRPPARLGYPPSSGRR